ncbi:MAG: hypothetical protein IJ087_15470 [Eggerthellaceae bacterium]|nr:hypothetical protein [Eggerthellaceae bacterium]
MTSNLKHKRFGNLVVEGVTGKHVDGLVVWLCRCDCGGSVEATTSQLTRGEVRCCGKLDCPASARLGMGGSLVGRRIGLLTVTGVGSVGEKDMTYSCRCDCGTEPFEALHSALASGRVRDCGCVELGRARHNLVGRRFGQLTVLGPTGERKDNCLVWRCLCDCGRECEVPTSQLTSGARKSCGCLRWNNLAGQRFGRLVAIEPTEKRVRHSIVWRCKCDCGNEREIPSRQLLNGNSRSCGCSRKRLSREDLAGQRFGKLVAVEAVGKTSWGSMVWRCECDCGKTCEASAKSLKAGAKRSCGCLRGNPGGYFEASDLAGQRFGRLFAVEPTEKRQRGSVVWRCRCDCGELRDVSAFTLKRGHAKSCGKCD